MIKNQIATHQKNNDKKIGKMRGYGVWTLVSKTRLQRHTTILQLHVLVLFNLEKKTWG